MANNDNKMSYNKEMLLTEQRNYKKLRELIRVSFGIGVNLTAPTRFKECLRIINVILLVSSTLSLYAHWSRFIKYIDNIAKMAESICTAMQAIISIVKLFWYLFMQHRFYIMLQKAQSHELLYRIEIFHKDFAIARQLKLEVEQLMNGIWREIRLQILFYFSCCMSILCNYFFYAVFANLYHQQKQTPNYEHILPFPVTYALWEDKGMSFPYYEIEMYLTGAALYIAGMAAVSFDGVFVVLSLHSVGLIEVLKLLLRHSTAAEVPKERRVEYMQYCINHYNRTYAYVEELQRLYQHISISQFLLSLIVLGIVMFQMSVGLESDKITLIRMVMYISAAGCEVIIYCYNGQRLTTASEEIPDAFYNCAWYEECPQFKQLIQMMILRSNRIFKVDISWFSTMSLPTLLSLVQTSSSYFLLLRNLSE